MIRSMSCLTSLSTLLFLFQGLHTTFYSIELECLKTSNSPPVPSGPTFSKLFFFFLHNKYWRRHLQEFIQEPNISSNSLQLLLLNIDIELQVGNRNVCIPQPSAKLKLNKRPEPLQYQAKESKK